MRVILWSGLVILAWANAPAQTDASSHLHHEPEAKFRELPPPPLMQGIGDASLKITTTAERAQSYFDQGLKLLHCFWDFEAYRAFKEAARLDPSAAMAYWGEFEALGFGGKFGPMQDEKRAALEKAKSLASKASEHEQFYIRAAEHQDKPDDPKERAAYQREMEALIDRYPDDLNAQTFLGLGVMGGYETDGQPREGELYAQAILRNVLAGHPDNAAANHYWIHAMEASSRPEAALKSAAVLASLAPNSGHMVHMPGHIYWRVGDYARARDSFLAAMRIDEAYMANQHIRPEEDWNYAHNLAYLIAACAEGGRYQEGLQWAQKLRGMPAPTGMTSARFVTWAGGSVVRLHIRFGDWQAVEGEAIEFGTDRASATPAAKAYAEGISFYAKGMAAIERADPAEASKQAEALDALLWRLSASKPKEQDKDKEQNPDEEDPSQVLDILGTMSLDLRGNIKSVQGEWEEAFKLIQRSIEKEKDLGYSEPPRYYRPELESLGSAYLGAHQWGKARDAFTQALSQRPKSGHALYGIARSYALAGDMPKAVQAYRDFLAEWQDADKDLLQVKQAHAWLAAHGQ
jgi:tetratricopeptide (TPR) repeat protein